ncbi:hypothetical protein PQQ84_33220 [Paraburkholderia strydomiana]|uniref:hypothetical protein n=1 Tax=Paraburkholderia strydomiana TaxID=1245417 RepID=UPI0038B9729D
MRHKANHSFPRFERFRSAADNALQSAVEPLIDEAISDSDIYESIRSALRGPADPLGAANTHLATDVAGEMGEIAKEATIAHFLNGSPLEPYFAIAHVLRDALRQDNELPELSATDERWAEAIRLASKYALRWKEQHGNLHRPDPRHVTLARAVCFYIDRGVPLTYNGDHVAIDSPRSAATLAATLTTPLSALGDTVTMQAIDRMLTAQYEPLIGRMHFHPTPDMMGRKLDRSLPCGLIYRYGLRTLGRSRKTFATKATIAQVPELAIHFAALHDVEPFSVYETTFPPKPGRVLEVLQRVATYDELFSIPQCRPEVMSQLIDGLFARVRTDAATMTLKWGIEEVKAFWRLLCELCVHPSSSTFVDRDRFKDLLSHRVGRESCDGLLRSFLLNTPNARYNFPSDAHRSETRECVIAFASNNRYWLPPRVLLGPPFYERLFASFVEHMPTMSASLGRAFEAHLLERMKKLGINCRSGNIRGKRKGERAGDADLIVETDEVVGLFELKKKGLRRETNAGNDLQLAADLAQGFVHGINQLAKHEITLLRDGKLQFEDGPDLSLNGRRVFKGVISLADYGGLHDSSVVRNALRGLSGVTISPRRSISDEQRDAVETSNNIFKTLGERYAAFQELGIESAGRDLFDNVVFHNVFFIEELLTTASTSELFLKALMMGTRVSTGSRDPFFERAHFNGALGLG